MTYLTGVEEAASPPSYTRAARRSQVMPHRITGRQHETFGQTPPSSHPSFPEDSSWHQIRQHMNVNERRLRRNEGDSVRINVVIVHGRWSCDCNRLRGCRHSFVVRIYKTTSEPFANRRSCFPPDVIKCLEEGAQHIVVSRTSANIS